MAESLLDRSSSDPRLAEVDLDLEVAEKDGRRGIAPATAAAAAGAGMEEDEDDEEDEEEEDEEDEDDVGLAHGACATPELAATKAAAAVAGEYWDSSDAAVAGDAPSSCRSRVGGGGGPRGSGSPEV